jgi:predicted NBD/HSP70 family sugar kinase/mannose-6-phosphate isomerase class I
MSKKDSTYALGVDIGGTHISAAIVDIAKKSIVSNTKVYKAIDSHEEALKILDGWVDCMEQILTKFNEFPIKGVGISMPGPANYEMGISEMFDCNKYENLFGVDLRNYLWRKMEKWLSHPNDIIFINDADSFLLGESWVENLSQKNVVAITLGTGIGSGFLSKGKIVRNAKNLPSNGDVFNLPFKNKRAEDWFSSQWLLHAYEKTIGKRAKNVKEIADQAISSREIQTIFDAFGKNLGSFLSPILSNFKAETLILGGNITKGYSLYKSAFESCFTDNLPYIHFAKDTEDSAILGAVKYLDNIKRDTAELRVTKQHLMPVKYEKEELHESYNIYPSYEIVKGKIEEGFLGLAKDIAAEQRICIDGYIGVNWEDFVTKLTGALKNMGVNCIVYSVNSALKNHDEIDLLVAPFLGGDDPVFGRICSHELCDFFDLEKLNNINPSAKCVSILFGTGAALSNWDAKIIYVDVPKNEIQYRSRAGKVLNIGSKRSINAKKQYKRMFFIDWPVLNKHKKALLNKIDYIVDGQQLDTISWCTGVTMRSNLASMSKNSFRVRPWFEPGVWGGNWIKDTIEGLNKDIVNYAWSFELIVPENGIVFSKKGVRLELSFDMLMYFDNQAILGDAAAIFGTIFPIRFDFLDTFDGANLSLQCHPYPDFIKEQFLEKFTQDETYYMLDATPNAKVYLGFQENISKEQFHEALLKSEYEGSAMDVEKYVQVHPAKKHDLFLIPHGTIHCSGKNGMVLEISSTPYIYTFKLYDWMRTDLDGTPRPLNISRGIQNLNFDCKGDKVREEYISKQTVISKGKDWKIVNLSTHPKHFYEIYRLEFISKITIENNGQCHVLNLVEGQQVKVVTNERSMIVNYAETFVVPAATKEYSLINLGNSEVKVIKSHVKQHLKNHEI